jgi:hypothetical protein
MEEIEVEMPDGTILVFPASMDQADIQAAARSYFEANQPAPVAGTSQAEIDAGLVPSGDTDTRSTAELTGGPAGGEGFDQASALSAPLFDAAGQAMRGATGRGPSVVGGMLQDGVNLGYGGPVQVPEGVANVVGRVADLGLAGMSAGAGLFSGAAGAVGDVAEAAGVPGAERLGRDLAALPEAFAGSPGMLARPAAGVARAVDLPTASAHNTPTLPTGSAGRAQSRPTPDRLGSDIRAASGGRASAAQRVATAADVDPNAVAAADRLQMELPADVLANNTLVQEAAGLTRSIAGTPTSAAWRDTLARAAERASDAIEQLGGGVDLSSVSARVLDTLQETRATLKSRASELYDGVDASVPKGTVIEPVNTVRAMNAVLNELGGPSGMSPAERRLFDMVTNRDQPNITYERLMREKRAIQRAIRTGDGPYGDADQFLLQRLERALVQDQLDNVENIGGRPVRENLQTANALTRQQKDLETSIVSAFGRDMNGSIAGTLRTAISSAARGDLKGLNRVLEVVPEELRGEAVATAIGNLAQSNRADSPGFGFAEFAKFHENLRKNRQAYNVVTSALTPEATQIMDDLGNISRRITQARANVLTTGKANQALLQGMTAENFIARVMQTTVGGGLTRAVGAGLGAATAGPVGAGVGANASSSLIGMLTSGKQSRIQRAGELFNSPEFNRLAVQAAVKPPSQSTMRAFINSQPFKRWARAVGGIENPEQWLSGIMVSGQQATQEVDNASN